MQRFVATSTGVSSVLEKFGSKSHLVLDTETTGLRWYDNARPFAVQLCDGETSVYFNLKSYEGLDSSFVLDKTAFFSALQRHILNREDLVLVGHNLGFDLHMLEAEGLEPKCKTWDTLVTAQILYNGHSHYSLEACAERIGHKKDDAVWAYIEAEELFSVETDPLTGKTTKEPRFDLVPFDIMSEYGLTDVQVTWELFKHQVESIRAANVGKEFLPKIFEIEQKVLPVIVSMEREGIRVDRAYAKEAYEHDTREIELLNLQWTEKTGVEFVDSAKSLGPYLESLGLTLQKTPDGNPSVASWVLENFDHEAVRHVLRHRDLSKRANTYFANILKYTDSDGFIHAEFKQRGAYATGRMSGRNPNLQNVSKGEVGEFPIRRAFLPRYDYLIEKDYKAQEFRLIVDYSGERELAERIRGGEDPHQIVADTTGLSRDAAKIFNFGLIYGMGIAKLAKLLKCSDMEAKMQKGQYFHRLRGVQRFIYAASDAAKARGFVKGWDGTVYYFPDTSKAYQAGNRIIQGGSASISKYAMVLAHEYLRANGLQAKLLSQVHDSLLFDVPRDELEHFADGGAIDQCMINAYPHKIMPMGVSTEWSNTNWQEMRKGVPT